MKFKKKTILFRTIVGSHMWGQHHSQSDKDMFECHIFDTRSFMLGDRHDGCEKTKGDNWEKDSCEIGHVIKQLLKGNVNFLWGVMSPKFDLVCTNIDPTFFNLRGIVESNLSKATVHSIRGFAIHNLRHWFGIKVEKKLCMCGNTLYVITNNKIPRLEPKDKKYWKILNTCARTLDFGIKLLRDGVLDFENPRGAKETKDVIGLLNELETAYKESELPDKPDPVPFEEFLILTRFSDLKSWRNR